ncbi:MAG TPA: DegQ family serine endoprotease [Terracidiphilus sp.]|nr:DegQ family serine endoprotease [Terracidiphilus sp.]
MNLPVTDPVKTPSRKLPFILIALVVLALVVGGLLRAGILHAPGFMSPAAKHVAVKVANDSSPLNLANFQNGFASVIDPDLPAVVNISSTKVVHEQQAPNVFSDPFFRQFFGNQFGGQPQQPLTEREHSLGSGVIVNPDGYILTNNHVVAGASDVEVFTQNHRKYRAHIVGTDSRTDIAVLKINASGLPAFTFGDSTDLKVGDLVFAIGDPFGIGETATMGIVSATGRALGGSIEHYEDFIQTDAAINPGNSGGALIDLRGHLIGINTAIISGDGGGNEGIGFAIPINMAHRIMDQIVAHGHVVRGYLGVTIQNVDPDMAKAFGLSQGGGALVANVTPGSPAAKAGLQRGDIILKLDGDDVSGSSDLSVHVSEMAPGATAHLQVFRNGHTQNVNVQLGAFPESGTMGAPVEGTGSALQGVQVQDLTSNLAQQMGLPPGTSGVVVTGVDPSSSAAAAGLQHGDVIEEVDHQPVHNLQEYNKAIAGRADQPVLLLVSRGGQTSFVVVEPQQ